jgi:uncharacterized protein (TIGR00369 family)
VSSTGRREFDLLRQLMPAQPFLVLMGIDLIDAGPGWVRERMPIRAEFLQPDVAHGGAIYSLADTACAHAALTLVYPSEWVTTVDQKISFLRPVDSGVVICNGKVVQLGKRIAFCEAQIVNDSGVPIATSSATLMRLPR